ncbi:hypothetical protein CTZ27_27100 [Streptomyces griseocarneus]|nr:hypothetical protein CTZ27_27100 [Streptomyces griseocarneus]
MREHKQGRPTTGTRAEDDQHTHSRPSAGENTAPEERTRVRRIFQVGPYIVETNPERSSC